MEIQKKARFLTDFYGSAPAKGAQGILEKWIADKQTAWLASWAEQIAKKGQGAIDVLEEILSIFHRHEGKPILGNWMLRRCLVITGQTIFNAMVNKGDPKKDMIPMAIKLVEPIFIKLSNGNGKQIERPEGVKTYTVSLSKKNRSFFKAYETISAGAVFETKMLIDETILTPAQIDNILNRCGSVGVGAFRERFGKFEWIN